MGSRKVKLSSKAVLPFKTGNKLKRQDLFAKQKKARENLTRDDRMSRKRAEAKDPRLREERRKQNIPLTIDRKRTWDNIDPDVEDGLGLSVDVERMKRQRLEEEAEANEIISARDDGEGGLEDDDHDSMIDSATDTDEDVVAEKPRPRRALKTPTERATSPTQSTTSTNLTITPEALATKFPSLFSDEERETKILITTSINSTLHHEAELLTSFFPRSRYVPRSQHRFSHKYSVKEIASFASARGFTSLVILMEDHKTPVGLDIINLPDGPHCHFSMSHFVEGKKLPGHGRSTGHFPELILTNFRTPLGLLTARLFTTLFPRQPEFIGREVVTIANSRDYLFVRRHRYVFREKKGSEKAVVGTDGKELSGVEGIKAGLQELGPRFTLKLRRIDKGIQRSSGQEWEWKGKTDKTRTKFQL